MQRLSCRLAIGIATAEVAAGAAGGWGSYEIVRFRRCLHLSRQADTTTNVPPTIRKYHNALDDQKIETSLSLRYCASRDTDGLDQQLTMVSVEDMVRKLEDRVAATELKNKPNLGCWQWLIVCLFVLGVSAYVVWV
ncbi:hypothetical protein PIB30_073987 [Stylosanthes scabra]|uniref:Uncharacterized protein n=1 Tax=Stylosanthes scabra TaxID=79078 RepID=A0ABU6SQI9_9FABA|nr:hypothetical protein [Stylosanthes scabra]